MKILVVDFAASNGGALSILKDYYEEIKNDNKNEYIFLLNDFYIKETENIKVIICKKYKSWINRLKFDFIEGKKIVKKYNPNLIFSLQNTIIRNIDVKQILYVHQSIPFQNVKKFSFFKRSELKLAIIQYLIGACIKSSIKKADKVIVQTKWMKEAVSNCCKINSSKICIVTPKIKEIDKKTVKKINNKRFFYPTSNAIYKNNAIIYEAVKLLNRDNIEDFEVELTIQGESTNNIKKIGRLNREEVFNKYTNTILIFPSYIETIGLPLLEAKKVGTIILASDTEFSHEVLDNYTNAYFFNPFSAHELKELIKKCVLKKISLIQDYKSSEIEKGNNLTKEVNNFIKNNNLVLQESVENENN